MTDAKGYRGLLRMAQPRRLLLASIPADFADWLDYAAVISLLVYVRGEGPLILGVFAVVLSLPYILLGPFIAVWVDRLPLKSVLVWSNLGRGVVTLTLFLLPPTPILLALVFLRGAVDCAFTPARQAAIKMTTPDAVLSEANGLHQTVNQTSKILGPALGGVWVAMWPVQTLFVCNAGISILAAVLILWIDLPSKLHSETEQKGFFVEALAGLSEFGRSARLRLVLFLMCAAYFSIFLYDALIGLLASEMGFGPDVFGLSIAASGVGGVIGGLAAGRIAGAAPIRWMVGGAFLSGIGATCLALAAFAGISISKWFFVGVLLAAGLSSAFMMVPYRTIVQQETPQERLGRVYAAGEAAATIAIVTAPFVGSTVAELFGTPYAFLAGGLMLLGLGVATLVSRR